VAITKVAAFIQGPPEATRNGFSSTDEADLVSALMYFHSQVKSGSIPLVYFARFFVPFYLVHALPGRSLIISGIGEPTITVRHSTIPSLADLREQVRTIDQPEQVPNLLGKIIQTFDQPPSELVVLRNAMFPAMIETFRLLVDAGIPPPREEACLRSRLSTKEIHDAGILFRNERARLDGNLAQLGQVESFLDEFVDEQLQNLDAKRDRMSPGASLRWETPSTETTPPPSFFADDPTEKLDQEKERISQDLAELIKKLENTLGLSTDQCRRLISQIQAKPTNTEWHLANVKTRLTELENTASLFQAVIKQAISEIDDKMGQLKEAEQNFEWSQEEPLTQPDAPFPSGTLVYSSPTQESPVDAKLSELDMVREATVSLHKDLRGVLANLRSTIEKEYRQFAAISAPADTLQGYLPLMRLVVPVFVIKVGGSEERYGVIPPLRLHEGTQSEYYVEMFDEVFGEQLIQLLRTEIRSNATFRQQLDEQAREINWLTKPFSSENIQRGSRQLANYRLLSYETREQIAQFWSNLILQ
jgi:hypothetical protein